jgi:aspartate/methionine/tyrosine aminotransferase
MRLTRKGIKVAFLDVGGRTWEELAKDSKIVHMGHNCNHLPLDPSINEAMIEVLRGNHYRNYPPPYGTDELREAIRRDAGIDDTEVLVTNGSTEAIFQALALMLREPGETIVSDPAWPHIASFARNLGSSVVHVPVYAANCNYKLTADLLHRFVTDKTRVIAVIDPLNPLGSSYTEQEIKTICDIAAARGIYVLHDCTYRDFAPAFVPALRYYDRVVMTVSLSKSCGFAGLRLGALIARPDIFGRNAENQIARLGVNIATQAGALAAYRTKQTWLPNMLETNRRHQGALKACFDTVDGMRTLVYPSMGNFLAADVTGMGIEAEAVVRRTLEAGFVIRSGAYTSENFGERFIRVTTTVPTDHIERFCRAFPQALNRDSSIAQGVA